MLVKSREEETHLNDLQLVFARCMWYLLMNPLICAFGVMAGKLLDCVSIDMEWTMTSPKV